MRLDKIEHQFKLRAAINDAVLQICSWLVNYEIGAVDLIRWVQEDDELKLSANVILSIGHRPRMTYEIIVHCTQSYKPRYFCTHSNYHSLRTLMRYLEKQKEALS